MFLFRKPTTPKRTITDIDIQNKSINDIQTLQNPENEFKLTNMSMHNSYKENDIEKMKFLNQQFNVSLPTQGNYHVDVAVENGNEQMAKFLVSEFNCQPSLYSKQMAEINGHVGLAQYMNSFVGQRNDTSVAIVHRRYNDKTKQFVWDSCIPKEFQFM